MICCRQVEYLLLVAGILDDSRTSPLIPVLFCLGRHWLAGTDVERTESTYKRWLEEAGFSPSNGPYIALRPACSSPEIKLKAVTHAITLGWSASRHFNLPWPGLRHYPKMSWAQCLNNHIALEELTQPQPCICLQCLTYCCHYSSAAPSPWLLSTRSIPYREPSFKQKSPILVTPSHLFIKSPSVEHIRVYA